MDNIESIDTAERYILVAVNSDNEDDAWASLDELADLLDTAGGETAAQIVQNLSHPDHSTYIGKGKALEVRQMLEMYDASGIICDDELTPSQLRNLSDLIDAKVIDRSMLILDIFASHASTREGRTQVEIAQLRYRYSRLRGMGEALSRLGGGIGTRGPGETKLETDRRVIQKRIKILSDDIESMKRSRDISRRRRTLNAVPVAAIVGYTNAGKSTILNRLTNASVLSEDKLFATLDPTTRSAILPDGQNILFTDTVGFINKLPHNLIDAFRSTLEEAKYADIIIHVVDASDEHYAIHMQVVRDTLKDLGIVGKPVITVWNKCDLLERTIRLKDFEADESVEISALTGDGIDRFYKAVSRIMRENRIHIDTVIPYTDAAVVAEIRKYGQLISEEFEPDGTHVTAYVPRALADRYSLI